MLKGDNMKIPDDKKEFFDRLNLTIFLVWSLVLLYILCLTGLIVYLIYRANGG